MAKDIVRFYRKSNKKKLIFSNVTIEQARIWCASPLTEKEGVYFDGFAEHHAYHTNNVAPLYQHFFEPTAEYH